MVYQMANPWTQTGRTIEIEKAVAEIYARYFARGPKWVAKHLPQRQEMSQYGATVSAETKEMLLGDFGVESFIEDYALWATYATGESTSTGQIYTQWVSDETRHSRALWYCLVDSALYTQQQVDEYYHECSQDVWSFERQTGYEPTPARGAAYAIAQERQTKRNYQSLQKRVWEEYGSPQDSNEKPVYPAIAGVCLPGDHTRVPPLLARQGIAGDVGSVREVPNANSQAPQRRGLHRSRSIDRHRFRARRHH
jgi:hypothetical protein